jgi:ubiquinone/menaquinone biosynthesis C-methylase UbiE
VGYYDYKVRRGPTAMGQKVTERTNDRIFRDVAAHLPTGAAVLEIGPGAGEFARRCIEHRYRYSAVEANESYFNALRQMGAQEVVRGFAPPIGFPDQQFDLVYMAHVLEHMRDGNHALEMATECHRVLKPGGFVSFVVPDFLYDPQLFIDGDYTHAFFTTENRLRMLLADADFEIVFCRGLVGPLTGPLAWFSATAAKAYRYLVFRPFIWSWRNRVDPARLLKLRTNLWRVVFVLARKS